jgi:type IV pilus assembly protein PilM
MFRLRRHQPQPIGVDLGSDSIKLLQVETVGEQLRVVASALDDAGAFSTFSQRLNHAGERVREQLRSGGFVGRRAVVGVPHELVQVKNLRLPVMPGIELANAIEYEARTVFPFGAEQAEIRHLIAGEVRQGAESKIEVIVFAVPREPLDELVETMHRAGVIVDGLDLEPCAMYRTIERFIRRREDEQDVTVLVDVGRSRSQVVIGRGRDFSFVKSIDLGGRHLSELVARKLSISEGEAAALRRRCSVNDRDDGDPVQHAVFDATRVLTEQLAREVSLCLRYYSVTFRGQRPARVRVCGGEGFDRQLISSLNALLTIPVETARPLAGVDVSAMPEDVRDGPLCQWAVPFGLALKRTVGPFRPGPGNELSGPRATTAEVIDMHSAVEENVAEAVHA